MDPELWSLVQSASVETLLRKAAAGEGVPVRTFPDVADLLSREEPAGGVVLAIDGTGRFKNYLTILKRLQRNYIRIRRHRAGSAEILRSDHPGAFSRGRSLPAPFP